MRVTGEDFNELQEKVVALAVAAFGILRDRKNNGFEFTKRTNYPHYTADGTSTYRPVTWDSGPQAPLNYVAVFGYARNYDTVISYDDIPGVPELTAFIANQAQLHEFLWPERHRDFLTEDYLTGTATALPLAMVERHIHLNGWELDSEALKGYFLELTRFWIQEKLDVELLIPILAIHFDSDHFELDKDVHLRRLTDPEQRARWPGERLGDNDGFIEMATHALVVRNWYITPQDQPASMFMSAPPEHVEQADRFFRALASVTDAPSGYNQILIHPVGWAQSYTADLPRLDPTTLIGDRRSTRLTKATEPLDHLDAKDLADLKQAYNLDTSNKHIRLASERLTSAELRTVEADRVVDLCIGLEALLSDAKGETTYKIAVRGATLLAHSGIENASDFYRALKRIYGYRSAIVHGSSNPPAVTTTIAGVEYRTEDLTRKILRRLLSTRVAEPGLTPEAIDTQLLSAAIDALASSTSPTDPAPTMTTATAWLAEIAKSQDST